MTGAVTGSAERLRRVLIANRGEIAIRIARAADALGIESVAVYPPADERALHTRVTTERRVIGAEGDPLAAYLDAEALIAVAVEAGCDCVHPGYGFLAENAGFASRCADAGITFVGPSPRRCRCSATRSPPGRWHARSGWPSSRAARRRWRRRPTRRRSPLASATP